MTQIVYRYGRPPQRLIIGSFHARVLPARWMPEDYVVPGLALRHFWLVRVFETVERLRAYAAWRGSERPDEADAIVMPRDRKRYDRKRRSWRVMPKLGEVCFHLGSLREHVIAHEAVHVASSTLRIFNGERAVNLGDSIGAREEQLAYLVTTVVWQIHSLNQSAPWLQSPKRVSPSSQRIQPVAESSSASPSPRGSRSAHGSPIYEAVSQIILEGGA